MNALRIIRKLSAEYCVLKRTYHFIEIIYKVTLFCSDNKNIFAIVIFNFLKNFGYFTYHNLLLKIINKQRKRKSVCESEYSNF